MPPRVILACAAALLALLPEATAAGIHASSARKFIDAPSSRAEADRITFIPGYYSNLKSKHYGGYINVSATKHMYYYFAESQGNPETDPVVLWLNGGPGCSSLDGFVYELGPFKFAASAHHPGDLSSPPVTLTDNPHAWNKVANVIFLESPTGVGLSYSTDSTGRDYLTGDSQTAADADTFLRGFFERHDSFQANDFYISGESYAGIYVPNLAREVAAGNVAGTTPPINLVGYLVGNGCTDEEVDGNAIPSFAYGKSLIGRKTFEALEAACGGSYWNRTSGSACDEHYEKMVGALSGLNIYNVLGDCYHGPDPDAAATARAKLTAARAQNPGQWPLAPGSSSRVGKQLSFGGLSLGHSPPCTDAVLAHAWLNNAHVRDAIHAAPTEVAGPWQLCSDRVDYVRELSTMLPIHMHLTREVGLRALIYSGDHDLCVPHTGSERWTAGMGYSVKKPWAPWLDADDQVAGYTVEYDYGLTYATVKGAGHMVPQTNPREALAMFERFVLGRSLLSA
ncbi:hypothetical protein FOA52_011219 [Chlamydomonas sp. UWO 241]|nr:hypothetical protein FOA52_011219 [Chlamydomonas sp. UWO 241]